ncbi:MAG: gliding motility lipoprotein GldD [Bacteroidetes bacterium]|nr:gliding motility lipoprotein GldD [Bacteroidota bacterium]
MKLNNILKYLYAAFLLVSLVSCGDRDTMPKPKGYFRIDLPVKKYVMFDSVYPYSFEYSVYSKIIPDTNKNAEPFWINLYYPRFNGTIHISYKYVKHNFAKYAEDSYNLAMKHISKANNIDNDRFDFPENNIHGIIFNIEGNDAASPYQFFLTDSISNFVRGALYFNIKPNNDSLSPVIGDIKEDILHIIKTFKWKKY